MLMMRLQRVGRRNDPSYRIVVTDKRTGPKSNKHVATLGSYSPKMNHIQIKGDEAKEWIGKGVQLSTTVHNLLVSEKIIDGKKVNALPRKAPIVDPEAEAKAAEEAAAAEAAEAETENSEAEAPTEESTDSSEESTETSENAEAEAKEEAPAEEESAAEATQETEEETTKS